MKFEYKFSQDIETVATQLTDPQFLVDRAIALGALSAEGDVIEEGGRRELTLARTLENDLPRFVAKILGATQHLEVKEIWQRNGDEWEGTSEAKALGKPVVVRINFKLVATAKGCTFCADPGAQVSIPLIGKKIEKFLNGKVLEEMTTDMDYTSEQLSA